MGLNAILRILLLEYILVIFSGFVTFRTELYAIYNGSIEESQLSNEFLTFGACLAIPLLLAILLPCCKKECLSKERTELNINTYYYKSNL